jgi:hypothetical protein
LLEVAFKSYCKQFFREAVEDWETALNGKGSWFAKYKEVFGQLGINWEASGANLVQIEQVFLTRNDMMHQDGLWLVLQSETHFRKYPDSAFANPIDLIASVDENGERVGPLHIEINRDQITQSIAEITKLCRYIEAHPDGQTLRFLGSRYNRS